MKLDRLQIRYLRNALTAWVVIVFLYCAFYWALPLSYSQLMVLYILGAFIYGCWFFGKERR